jgi:hypothetical protein
MLRKRSITTTRRQTAWKQPKCMKDKISNQVRIQLVRWVNPAWLRLLVTLAVLWSSGIVQANIRLEVTGGPFYARIAGGEYPEIYHNGEWAAIAFYRDPECVQTDFNLLEFINPAALDCDSFVAGFEIWKNGPGTDDQAPIQSRLQNTEDMPIWFVSWTELQTAIADGVLTIGELKDLPHLIGTATFYTETLHPLGGGPQTKITIVASGVLEDGRKFNFQATGTKEQNRLNHVMIEFK